MANRKTDLGYDKARGFYRNLGRQQSGSQTKFLLGHNKPEAEAKLAAILALWEAVEARHNAHSPPHFITQEDAVWDHDSLVAAKQIAKGERARVGKINGVMGEPIESAKKYYARVNQAGAIATDPVHYAHGQAGFEGDIISAVKAAEAANPTRQRATAPHKATGVTFHAALAQYSQHIEVEYRDTDGGLRPQGVNTKAVLRNIPHYVPDFDLSELTLAKLDDVVYGTFRRRPKGRKNGTRLKPKSVSHIFGTLDRFVLWLHKSNLPWQRPADIDLIAKEIQDAKEDRHDKQNDIPTWTIPELKTLFQFASPQERMVLLLGLNNAYGSDQSGTLQPDHIKLVGKTKSGKPVYYSKQRRNKTGAWSIHRLWPETVEGLQWTINNRAKGCENYVLVSRQGRQLYHKCPNGSASQRLPNMWNGLLDRVQKVYPKFRRLPLNSLRDTSADLVRQHKLGGPENASIHLAHGKKRQAADPLLANYSNPNRKRHAKVLGRLRNKLIEAITAGEPWGSKKHLHRNTEIARDASIAAKRKAAAERLQST
jgi:hypothetical protein